MGCHFFFYFLGEKSLARVAKVPAAILDPVARLSNFYSLLKSQYLV